MKKISSRLYDISRKNMNLASKISTVELILTGNVKQLVKKAINKKVFKATNSMATKFRLK